MNAEKLSDLKKRFAVNGVEPIDVVETYPNCFMPIYQKHIDQVNKYIENEMEALMTKELHRLSNSKP